MLIRNDIGGYSFLPGGDAFSGAVLADDDHEIVHAAFRESLPFEEGFPRIEAHLGDNGLSPRALCALELRSPAPYGRAGFLELNAEYLRWLDAWELRVEGRMPVARSNIAPAVDPPEAPSLFGFSYAIPRSGAKPKSFVVSGIGELRRGPVMTAESVREGETSEDALIEKTRFIVETTKTRLEEIGAEWSDVTRLNFYTVHPLTGWFETALWDGIGAAAHVGVQWFRAHPPIDVMIVEMDVRGIREEIVLD
jgi:hypothetical protein